jgi:hypothetical protein
MVNKPFTRPTLKSLPSIVRAMDSEPSDAITLVVGV